MTEQLQAKIQIIDNMTVDEIKAMTIFEFNEFAVGIGHMEARTLLIHFFDRLGHIIQKLPSVDFGDGYIEEILYDYNALEVTVDRFFEDTLPALEKRCSEIPYGIRREIDAAEVIYNTLSEKISQDLNSYLEE